MSFYEGNVSGKMKPCQGYAGTAQKAFSSEIKCTVWFLSTSEIADVLTNTLIIVSFKGQELF